MRRPTALTAEQHLYLTPAKSASIRVSLKAWMGYRSIYHAAEFNCSAVDALGLLLADDDVMSDFLSHHARIALRRREFRARQVRYVALHWLADIASGMEGDLIG